MQYVDLATTAFTVTAPVVTDVGSGIVMTALETAHVFPDGPQACALVS